MNWFSRIGFLGLFVLALSCGSENGKAKLDVTGEPDRQGEDVPTYPEVAEESRSEDVPSPDAVDAGDMGGDVCVAACEGKVCGDDGCGGSCGDCGEGEQCTAEGQCQATACSSDADCAAAEQVCDEESGQCVDCLESADCAEEEYCSEQLCLPDVCGPEERTCEGSDVLACLADGSGFTVEVTCTATEYCEDGACHVQVCSPGEGYCEGEQAIQCDALGKEFIETANCADEELHCFEGQCIDSVCLPGTVFCADGFSTAECNEDGSDFVAAPCPDEHYCAKGTCKPWMCTPGELLCVGHVATMCDELGKGPAPGGDDCTESGLLCIGGICTKCYPDCFGKECGDDGCGGSCGNCDDGDPCTVGTCDLEAFTCSYGPVVACCNSDEQCVDQDPCTIDQCLGNSCVNTNTCCESHQECEDGNSQCTHDLCLNDYCWYKAIPGAGCCPRVGIYEGFEFGVVPSWSLSADGQKKWAVSGQTAFAGGHSLVANKANTGALLQLPGTTEVSHAGTTLSFYYKTLGWTGLDCVTSGLQVLVNGTVADLLCAEAPEWTEYTLSLDGWAGQEVVVRLQYTVPWSHPTDHALYLDELQVAHECCTSNGQCDDGNFCTTDTCGAGACSHVALVGCCNPALFQEDFETLDPWGWSFSADGQKSWKLTQEDKHTGASSLLAGTEHSGAVVTLPGSYAIPTSGGKLKLWYKSVNWNTLTWGVDGLSVYVNGVAVTTMTTPAPAWSPLTIDLSGWAGHSVPLALKYQMGNQGNQGHRLYVDDLQVVQTCCQEDGQCDDGNACTTDKCGPWGGCVNSPQEGCCNPTLLEEDFDLGAVPDWTLSKNGQQAWNLTQADSLSGTWSLHAAHNMNGAAAVIPGKYEVPWSGGQLLFSYKAVNWQVISCATDGVKVLVNGAQASIACGPAATWQVHTVDLSPWAGQEVSIELLYQIVSGGNGAHEVFVDNVVVVRSCCEAAAECNDGNSCTTDSCKAGQCEHKRVPGCCGPALYEQSFDFGIAEGWSLSQNNGVWKWAINGDKAKSGTYSLAASVWTGQPIATLPLVGPLPASGATLELAYQTVGWNVIDCATMGLRVYANGVYAGSICSGSPDIWSTGQVDLSAWAGKEVVLQLQYLVGNPGNDGHAAWIDDVRVVPICCAGAVDCDDGDPCTEDSCGDKAGCIHELEADCCAPSVFDEGFEDGVAWGWKLSADNVKKWAVVAAPVHDGVYALAAGKASNAAVATLPPLPVIPWEGGYLSFWYQTTNWNVVDCNTMGIAVRVNGALADLVCEPAPEFTMTVVDLFPWAGESPVIELQYWVGDGGNGDHGAAIDDLQVAFECP